MKHIRDSWKFVVLFAGLVALLSVLDPLVFLFVELSDEFSAAPRANHAMAIVLVLGGFHLLLGGFLILRTAEDRVHE